MQHELSAAEGAPARAAPVLTLLHAEESFAVFAKPSGLLVHRGWGDDDVTATDLARQALGAPVSPLHRLDRGTSGVIVFTHGAETTAQLQRSFEAGEVEKTYLALVRGTPPDEGIVDHPIPRREGGPRVAAVTRFRTCFRVPDGPARELSADLRRVSLVVARPQTGRLHQVRRHLKHIHHPLIGDANYGKGPLNRLFAEALGLRRLALHALSLRLPHPRTGEMMVFRAALPDDLAGPFGLLGIPPESWQIEG